jgi:hypothetical protein
MRGPDTSQFHSLDESLPQTIKYLQSHGMQLYFKPNIEGRSSAQLALQSELKDSPHFVQLFGTGVSSVSDVTSFREVASPTAMTPNRGTLSLGTIDALAVLGSYSVTDNIMVIGAGLMPVTLNNQTSGLFTLGVKGGFEIAKKTRVALGYQFVRSSFDKSITNETDSKITTHAPYAVLTMGDDDAKASVSVGYAFKHHVTIDEPAGFDANAALFALSGDYRIGATWKLCGEVYSFQSLGYIPFVATVRYLGKNYALDAGFAFLGITTGETSIPSIPLAPVLGAMWVW